MSPSEARYREWLHELTMEQSSGSPYWHSPEIYNFDGPTWEQLRERDRFAKWKREREPR